MMNRKGFSLGFGALAGAALLTATAGAGASTIISHSGNVDPTTTGWELQSLQEISGDVTVLSHDNAGVTGDLGTHDAWMVARSDATYDGTGAGGGINSYKYTFSASEVAAMETNGFVLEAVMRPGDGENANQNSRVLRLNFWGKMYNFGLWSNLTVAETPEPRNFAVQALDSAAWTAQEDLGDTIQYYNLKIVHDPSIHATGAVDFYINDQLFLSATDGWTPFSNYEDVTEDFIVFGDQFNGLWNNTSPTNGTSYWASVNVSTIPEPASAALLGLGGLLLARRRRQTA